MPKDALYGRLASEGARFGVGLGGVEHPLYFAGPDVEINPAKFTHHDWEPIVKAEAQHIVDHVSLGHVVFSVFKVEGPGAGDLLEGLTTSNLPADTHKSKLMYMTNHSGLVVSEVTVCKLGDDDYCKTQPPPPARFQRAYHQVLMLGGFAVGIILRADHWQPHTPKTKKRRSKRRTLCRDPSGQRLSFCLLPAPVVRAPDFATLTPPHRRHSLGRAPSRRRGRRPRQPAD